MMNDKNVNPKLKITPRESQFHIVRIKIRLTTRMTSGTKNDTIPYAIRRVLLATYSGRRLKPVVG